MDLRNKTMGKLKWSTMLILPLGLGLPYAFSIWKRSKNLKDGYIFLFFYSLFLTYNFFSIDNLRRVSDIIQNKVTDTPWYLGDPLLNLMNLGSNIGLECSHFIMLFIFAIYCFIYKSFYVCNGKETNSLLVGFVLLTMSLRTVMDIIFYTLGFTFMIFASLTDSKCKWWNYKHFLIIPIIYLLHPGVLMIYLPAIGLLYINRLNKYWINILYLIALYYVTDLLVSSSDRLSFSNEVASSLSESLYNYTENPENKWANRTFALTGITYFIQYYGFASYVCIVFVLSLFKHQSVNQKMVLFIFQCGAVMLINFWNYHTLAERDMAGLALTTTLVLFMMLKNDAIGNIFNSKKLLCLIAAYFMFTFFRADGSNVKLRYMFKSGSYIEKQLTSYIIPSGFMLDYYHFGYSNDFIKEKGLWE